MKTVMAEPRSEKQLASNVKGVKFIKDKFTKELSQAREDQSEMKNKIKNAICFGPGESKRLLVKRLVND